MPLRDNYVGYSWNPFTNTTKDLEGPHPEKVAVVPALERRGLKRVTPNLGSRELPGRGGEEN